ncbi:MAG: MBL fold metallo-hydrolase [Patescibacteria group bacterium]|jgi:competence protein ComEC
MKKFRKKTKKIGILFLVLAIVFFFSISPWKEEKNTNLEVSFIDSDQADAILIQTPQEKNIIIDFGSTKGLKELDKKIKWWNKKIDLIIITHPHDDHIAGMISLIKKYKIEKIMYTGIIHSSPIYSELLETIKNKKIPLMIPAGQQTINLEENCQIAIIFPWDNFYNKEIENLNNSSIVSQLNCKNSKFLFMGDAENEVENEILEKEIAIKSDVLKVGHHGSITSTGQEFLERVSPEIAIVMVGKNNKFNHPSLRTLKKLEKLDIKTFRTDLDGTIDIISDGEKIWIEN